MLSHNAGSTKTRHILYADGDVKSTTDVKTILRRMDASLMHLRAKDDCLAFVTGGHCHLLVINMPRPGTEGMDLLTEARRRAPWIPIIMLVDAGQIDAAVHAMKAGAVNCIERPPQPRYLRSAVHEALQESEQVLEATPLTQVELGVLHHLLKGYTNRQIAAALRRSRRTVEVHRSNIMRKLAAEGPVDLIRKAMAAGFLAAFPVLARCEPPASASHDRPAGPGRPVQDIGTLPRPRAPRPSSTTCR